MNCDEAKRKAVKWENTVHVLKWAGIGVVLCFLASIVIWAQGRSFAIDMNDKDIRRLWDNKAGGNQIQELHDRIEKLEDQIENLNGYLLVVRERVNEAHPWPTPTPRPAEKEGE